MLQAGATAADNVMEAEVSWHNRS